jgi:hypothetical protein
VTRRRSWTEDGIPLWLLPQAVARKVREWGDGLYRISVKRTHWHHYNVTVRTRPIRKELAPVDVASISPDTQGGTVKRSRAGRRKCPV